MTRFVLSSCFSAALAAVLVIAAVAAPRQQNLSFFITSAGPGNGANLGGLDGADKHCQTLAAAAGAGGRTWRAYLSASSSGSQQAVHARDRIGAGPWFNAKGVQVAANVDDLHSDNNKLSKENSLTEKGAHDILTGSGLDGRLASGTGDVTCGNWTSTAADGSAMVGHHDRQGGGANPTSWNAAHASRGCSLPNLRATGGEGLYYCFAAR
jgi:hypothetical protein